LQLAYDETIEGWSRAFDIRDRETEGHTTRVTELTMLFAQTLGISDDNLINIRRGALLHDIGKIGIPDSIILKPGPLTEQEWIVMRRHPVYAYEMLNAIGYLRPALDIPYCHHERWDGSGYPRGLNGTQIPLAARIFALVDVYNAMISDRPYRRAYEKVHVLEYIRNQQGTFFDPENAKVFIRLMESGPSF
jgi:HD-GYP domain-containing protein (c-di-GMP phosphodiesterase class II)